MEPQNSGIPQVIRENLLVLCIGIGGVLLVGYGLFQVIKPQNDGVIIEKAQSHGTESAQSLSPTSTKKIVVDVEGAVKKPGIYSLPPESREQDAISAAGGLSVGADEQAIAKGMNMAAHLSDGMKLYLPFLGDTAAGSAQGSPGSSVEGASSLSINTASSSDLDSLPGVGQVTAGKIIQNRPYLSVEELLSKKAVTKATYEKIKDLVSL